MGPKPPSAPSSADPYDPYTPSAGREMATAFRRFGQEDFVGEPAPLTKPLNRSYAAQENDYKYYCDTHGICAKEGFEGGKLTVSKPKQACGPLQPPPYEFPIDEETKKYYKNAIDVANNQEQTATPPPKPQGRPVDMNKVSGYYDEDLEMYMETKDMKATPTPAMPVVPKKDVDALPYDPSASPFSEAMKEANAHANKVPVLGKTFVDRMVVTTPATRDTKGMWFDILLFFAAGVMFVFLCDQLVRLGMLLGMRRTVDLLTPFLEGKNA